MDLDPDGRAVACVGMGLSGGAAFLIGLNLGVMRYSCYDTCYHTTSEVEIAYGCSASAFLPGWAWIFQGASPGRLGSLPGG